MSYKFSVIKLIHNIPLLLSWAALAFLGFLPSGNGGAAWALIVAAAVAACFIRLDFRAVKQAVRPVPLLFALGLCLLLAAEFVLQLAGSAAILLLAGEALLLGFLSFYVLLYIVCLCWTYLEYPAPAVYQRREAPDWKGGLAAFAVALVVLGICSKSSPLYPFNDWGDPNCFVTVGKSMLHGLVPYRDLYEQKGPLLYMLHAVTAFLSWRSFFGVFLLELLAGTCFLFLCRRILSLYKLSGYLWLPVLGALVYGAKCFYQGDSAEELCLPFYAYGIYCGLKAIQGKRLPGAWESFFVGLTSACVLWIKFSMLGFYMGWFAAFAVLAIKWKQFPKLLRMLGFILAGVAALSLPILMYFWLNGSLEYLWQVYFLDNLFLYSRAGSSGGIPGLILNLCHGLGNFKNTSLPTFILILLGTLMLIRRRRYSELLFLLLSFIFSFFFVFVGGRYFVYYSLIFSAFAPIGLPPLSGLAARLRGTGRLKRVINFAVPLICALLSFAMSENTYLLRYERAQLPQFQFAEIINRKENVTLLNYGFLDGGFYTAAGIVPNCRFFSNLNIPLPEIMDTQRAFVAEGLVDFVVTKDSPLENAGLYTCVAESSMYLEGEDHDYYLYQLNR